MNDPKKDSIHSLFYVSHFLCLNLFHTSFTTTMWCTSNKISLEPPSIVSPEKLKEKDQEIKRLKRKVRRIANTHHHHHHLWNNIHVPCDERFKPASFDEYTVDDEKCVITKGMGDLLCG